MATFTSRQFIEARDPALSTLAGNRLDTLISMGETYFPDPSALGDKFVQCVALLVLHWLTLESVGGTLGAGAVAGPISSEREGDIARSYGSSTSAGGLFPFLDSTSYGKELDGLIRASAMSCGVTGPGIDPAEYPSFGFMI